VYPAWGALRRKVALYDIETPTIVGIFVSQTGRSLTHVDEAWRGTSVIRGYLCLEMHGACDAEY
jgi:hypothetical protein